MGYQESNALPHSNVPQVQLMGLVLPGSAVLGFLTPQPTNSKIIISDHQRGGGILIDGGRGLLKNLTNNRGGEGGLKEIKGMSVYKRGGLQDGA